MKCLTNVCFLLLNLAILFISSTTYAQTDVSTSKNAPINSKDNNISLNATGSSVTPKVKNHSIELLFGYGYPIHLNSSPEIENKYTEYFTKADELRQFRNSHYNINVGYSFSFNKYYSLGAELQYAVINQLSLLLINRITYPIPKATLNLYVDFPLGIELLTATYFKHNGFLLRLATRVGLSWHLSELISFNTRIGFEMGLNTPHRKKKYWHINDAAVSLALGFDFSF